MLSEKEPRSLIEETFNVLQKPLKDLSITQEIPPELTATLEENVFVFSGFKTYHELKEASMMLKDETGGFKSFERFSRDVESIDKKYNKNYLAAEYEFAVSSSQMAVRWKDLEKDGDRYDLQYRTAGDDRVREEHAALNGITLPPSDKFWNEYYPPNGWRCRCTAVQVRKGKYHESDSDEAVKAGEKATTQIGKNGTNKSKIFRFNPGKQEKIFPPKHPYYKTPEEVKKAVDNIIESYKKSEAYKETLAWGKENIIGKISYSNEAFGEKKAVFVKNSFTENMGKGDMLYAKIDVLKNIKSYLKDILVVTKEDVEHGNAKAIYSAVTKHKGTLSEFSERDIELTFKENTDGTIVFHFIKFM